MSVQMSIRMSIHVLFDRCLECLYDRISLVGDYGLYSYGLYSYGLRQDKPHGRGCTLHPAVAASLAPPIAEGAPYRCHWPRPAHRPLGYPSYVEGHDCGPRGLTRMRLGIIWVWMGYRRMGRSHWFQSSINPTFGCQSPGSATTSGLASEYLLSPSTVPSAPSDQKSHALHACDVLATARTRRHRTAAHMCNPWHTHACASRAAARGAAAAGWRRLQRWRRRNSRIRERRSSTWCVAVGGPGGGQQGTPKGSPSNDGWPLGNPTGKLEL